MYKKASRLQIRFESPVGPLTVEQLWKLNFDKLKDTVIYAKNELGKYEDKTTDGLEFLTGQSSKEAKLEEEARLKFDILKDVYLTRLNEVKENQQRVADAAEIQKLEQILMKKKEAEYDNMSADELEKLINEKRAGKK